MDIEKIEAENAETDILNSLVNGGYLEGAMEGVAKKVLAEGEDSLVGKQTNVYEAIKKQYFDIECERCHVPLPIGEISGALDEGDELCGWCRNQVAKYDKD